MSSSLKITPPNIDQTLLEVETAENAANERAARLWRFLAVTIGVWTYYCFYYTMRGYSEAALICFAEAVISCTFLLRFRKLKQHYDLLMHGCLTLSAIGLFTLSICRGSQLADTIYFIPCTIIIAAHLIGNRAAIIWCLASISITCWHFTYLSSGTSISADQLINAIGFSATVFFLCQQAEHLYEKRTNQLVTQSSKLRRQTLDIQKLAKTDALTGLDNRLSLVSSLKSCTTQAIRNRQQLAVMVIDMDGFKEVNDALGHAIGDEVLQSISKRLRSNLPDRAFAARLGGDEFCVLIPDISGREESEQIAGQIVMALQEPYCSSGEELYLDASIGICICPEMTEIPDELMAFADTAMYHAKQAKQTHKLYEPSMTDQIIHRINMQEKLSRALKHEEFRLVFQPQFDMSDGTVTSVEALLRWAHDGRIIPPSEFIPLLESSGEIVQVSRWIVEQCCVQICQWREAGFDIRISINLSTVEFGDNDFVESVADCIEQFQINASCLEFEITESLMIENVEETIERITRLKELGASISVDDFGTGYSSLSYLKQLPIDRLKIDRTFVKDIPHSDDGLLASSIIVLGQALGMKVIAEGVETKEQLQFLVEKGCDEYQGFLLSPPISAAECQEFFDSSIRTSSEFQHLIP